MGLKDKLLQSAANRGLVEQPDNSDAQQQELQDYADRMWHWLRTTLDEACDRYQHEGNDDLLRECLMDRALEDVRAFLDDMRRRNMVWTFPAEKRNEFEVRVDDVLDDTYVLTEYFRDYSRVERYQNEQLVEVLQGDGYEKALRATIIIEGELVRISQLALVVDPNEDL